MYIFDSQKAMRSQEFTNKEKLTILELLLLGEQNDRWENR